MRLSEIYSRHQPAISIEFFPPKTAEGDTALASRIPAIARLKPAFVTVTYGAGGSNRDKTLGWVRRLKEEFKLDVLCHLTCVGQSKDEVAGVLDELEKIGVDKIIALRGDPPRGQEEWRAHPDGYQHAVELVRVAAGRGFSVAVAGFPEGHPEAISRESDMNFLREKVDAGAESVTSQLFFSNEDFFHYLEDARRVGVSVPIVPGILPFRTVAELRRFCNVYARTMSGPARVPSHLDEQLEAAETDNDAAMRLGLDHATAQCQELLARGVPGIHFYCLNESKAVEEILSRLKLG